MTRQLQILAILKRELIGKSNTPISDIVLFGSQITGKAKSGSDYDVLIIPGQKPDWRQCRVIGDICAAISIENDILIDYRIISEDEIKHEPIGIHPLIVDALKYGIHA
jgi:predicted nucleotidyltransferase